MEGIIVNYRGSRRVKHTLQMIVEVHGVTTKDKATSLVGKKVTWTTPGKKLMNGVVSGAHGNSGALRVRFDVGMPGQSIGQKVKIE
jgi:large subunit ribosomal protein L35Ae